MLSVSNKVTVPQCKKHVNGEDDDDGCGHALTAYMEDGHGYYSYALVASIEGVDDDDDNGDYDYAPAV